MKKDKEAVKILRRAYNNLARSINAVSDLEIHFVGRDEKRLRKATKAVFLIMKAQDVLNPLAEDEDIRIV